jgi:methionine-rich copper-binding protein CopC
MRNGGVSHVRKTVAALWLIATGLMALLVAGPAWAHAEMTKSAPANGAVLTSSPAQIQAWFSEELAAKGNTLRLYDANNKVLATGGLDPKVPKHQGLRLVPTPRLGPGTYLVRWHVVAADDNAVSQGSFKFSVRGSAMAPPGMTKPSLPPLKLVAPASQGTLKNPVAIVVETPGDIKQLTMGGMGQMSGMSGMGDTGVHLHILVDGVASMPTSDQLMALGNHRYQYTLAPLSAGTHTVKVFWADNKTHQPLGPVQAATCTVTQ